MEVLNDAKLFFVWVTIVKQNEREFSKYKIAKTLGISITDVEAIAEKAKAKLQKKGYSSLTGEKIK
jgi:hypothetical protein